MSRPNEMIHCLGVIVWRLHYTVIKLSYLNTSLTGHACTLHIASAMVETDTVPPAPIGHSQPRNTHRFFLFTTSATQHGAHKRYIRYKSTTAQAYTCTPI